jgi:NAD(P)-dependent dehydrogenase (short-subunit alcohol dehydrogenase family)
MFEGATFIKGRGHMLEPSVPDFSLAGRKAIVTGASRGIGVALAVGLARFGADVAICARDLAALEPTRQQVEATGRQAVPFALDVRETAAIAPAIEQAVAALGGLDILINNAGVEQVRPSLEVDEALWDKIVDTNLKGAFFCAQAAARRMARGAIVNVCSLTSGVGVPTAVPYGSSKSGLLGMTRALAAEWAPDIRVNAIGPGYFRTELTEVFYQDPTWCAKMLEKIPAGRFGALDDLIGATVFLCSDAARYVTGQLLYIDGGYMASI